MSVNTVAFFGMMFSVRPGALSVPCGVRARILYRRDPDVSRLEVLQDPNDRGARRDELHDGETVDIDIDRY